MLINGAEKQAAQLYIKQIIQWMPRMRHNQGIQLTATVKALHPFHP